MVKRRYPAVLSVIYSVGLGVSAITYLVLFLGTLFGSMMDLNDAKGNDILEQFLVSVVAIAILCFALAYKLDLFKRMQKAIYVFVMGVIAITAVTLFLVFPAKEVREAVHDDNIASDLQTIESSITKYYADNNELPASLEDLLTLREKKNNDKKAEPYLDKNDLNYKLKNYEYTASNNNGRSSYYRSAQYQICAEFKTDTLNYDDDDYYYPSSYSYSYRYHGEGRQCFDRSAGGSRYYGYDYTNNSQNSYGNVPSYSYNYYDDEDEDDYDDEEDEDDDTWDWDYDDEEDEE